MKFPETNFGGHILQAEWLSDNRLVRVTHQEEETEYETSEQLLLRFGSFGVWLLLARHASTPDLEE